MAERPAADVGSFAVASMATWSVVFRQQLDVALCRMFDGVAATAGPGLIGGLIVGVTTGKAIALARGLPFGQGACAALAAV